MKTKKELLEVIKLCEEALESCGDNAGSESADNGDYETFFDDKLVEKALKEIREIKK